MFRLCLVFEYDDVIHHGDNGGGENGDDNGDDDDSAEQWLSNWWSLEMGLWIGLDSGPTTFGRARKSPLAQSMQTILEEYTAKEWG